VGAFGDAAAKLRANGLDQVVLEQAATGKPLMGICLGMQLLFDESLEYGCHKGLGLIPGRVVPIQQVIPEDLKIPHMGWNGLKIEKDSPLFSKISDGDCVYFVHSFCAVGCEDALIATAEYGTPVTAAVQKGNVFGCQFHPEKSGTVGLNILRAFAEMEANGC
jgi:glutamine amidotransferase